MKLNSHWPLLVIALLCIPLFFLGIHNTHNWGDDFSQYIQQGRNIATGRPFYQSSYIFNPHNPVYAPPQYPPGYPLLLAPVIKIWGLNYRAMFYLNSVLVAALYFVLYRWFRNRTHVIAAICLSTICVYCGFSTDAKQSVLSDVPCWLFTALYLLIREDRKLNVYKQLLMGAALLMAILIRTQAVFLVVAETLCWFIQALRNHRNILKIIVGNIPARVSIMTLIFFFILNSTLLRTPVSTLNFYLHDFVFHTEPYWHIIGRNANYLLTLFPTALHFTTIDPFWQSIVTIIEYTFLIFGLLGLLKTLREGITVVDAYFLLMCLLILIFPQHQGVRYIASVIPIFLWYCYSALSLLLPQILRINGRALCLSCTLLYLIMGYDDLQKSTEPIPGTIPAQREDMAFSYLRQHVPDTAVIAFTKPRVMALYTNKKFVNISWYISPEQNAAYLDSLHAGYILTLDGFEDVPFRDMFPILKPKDSVLVGGGYRLFIIR